MRSFISRMAAGAVLALALTGCSGKGRAGGNRQAELQQLLLAVLVVVTVDREGHGFAPCLRNSL